MFEHKISYERHVQAVQGRLPGVLRVNDSSDNPYVVSSNAIPRPPSRARPVSETPRPLRIALTRSDHGPKSSTDPNPNPNLNPV